MILSRHFKIYLNKKKYIKVFIFSRRDLMYKFEDIFRKNNNFIKFPHTYAALTTYYKWGKQDKIKSLKNQVGHILLDIDGSGSASIVSHEITHAVIYWWTDGMRGKKKWAKIIKDKKTEEKFCHLLGNMISQYWTQWYKICKKKIN